MLVWWVLWLISSIQLSLLGRNNKTRLTSRIHGEDLAYSQRTFTPVATCPPPHWRAVTPTFSLARKTQRVRSLSFAQS